MVHTEEIDLNKAFGELNSLAFGDTMHGVILEPKKIVVEEENHPLMMPTEFKKKAEGATFSIKIPEGEVQLARIVRVGDGEKAQQFKKGDIIQIMPKLKADFQRVIGDPDCVVLTPYDVTVRYTKKAKVADMIK